MAASTMREIDLPWGVPVEVAGMLTLLDVSIEGARARIETEEPARLQTKLQRENTRRLRRCVDKLGESPDTERA